jgi:transposase InsO family protein
MSKKKDEDIALFKYGIIARVLNERGLKQMEHFRQMSKQEYEVPHLGKKKFKAKTFKSWLRVYRNGGFEALMPKTRSDKGVSRKINDTLGKVIKEKLTNFPSLSASAHYRMLVSEGEIMLGSINEGTLRKYIKDNNLRACESERIPRKKYEKEHINELWISDGMKGPSILEGKKKRKTYLISIIDDCSRVIVAAGFFFHENSINLEIILKEAILRFGIPKVFYSDNGSIFISSHLQLACARLGIALVHSKPYDSPSRGKIERYHRTIRQKFLPLLELTDIQCLEDLNTSFSSWLDKEYHKCVHTGIKAKPLDKWMDDLKNTSIKRVSSYELDLACYMTIERKVKNDSTVSINGSLYEAPPKFIGKKIEIRYPIDKPDQLHLYENNHPVSRLKKVNPIENANPPAWGIKFDKGDE